jgi:hypothetical protein
MCDSYSETDGEDECLQPLAAAPAPAPAPAPKQTSKKRPADAPIDGPAPARKRSNPFTMSKPPAAASSAPPPPGPLPTDVAPEVSAELDVQVTSKDDAERRVGEYSACEVIANTRDGGSAPPNDALAEPNSTLHEINVGLLLRGAKGAAKMENALFNAQDLMKRRGFELKNATMYEQVEGSHVLVEGYPLSPLIACDYGADKEIKSLCALADDADEAVEMAKRMMQYTKEVSAGGSRAIEATCLMRVELTPGADCVRMGKDSEKAKRISNAIKDVSEGMDKKGELVIPMSKKVIQEILKHGDRTKGYFSTCTIEAVAGKSKPAHKKYSISWVGIQAADDDEVDLYSRCDFTAPKAQPVGTGRGKAHLKRADKGASKGAGKRAKAVSGESGSSNSHAAVNAENKKDEDDTVDEVVECDDEPIVAETTASSSTSTTAAAAPREDARLCSNVERLFSPRMVDSGDVGRYALSLKVEDSDRVVLTKKKGEIVICVY